ncbi:unnamed protein product [Discosporangium mesarthrocarpum]
MPAPANHGGSRCEEGKHSAMRESILDSDCASESQSSLSAPQTWRHYITSHLGSSIGVDKQRGQNEELKAVQTVMVAGEAIDLSAYPKFSSILSTTEDMVPQPRGVLWVMKLMEEIFDARRRAEQASYAAEEDEFNLDAGLRKPPSFPAFVYMHLKKRHGLQHLVRLSCLEILCATHIHRRSFPEVEIFARFLEEYYGAKELSFFL